MVQVVGIYFYGVDRYDNYQGIYVGNQLCEMRNPATNDYYGIDYKSGRHHVRCLVTEQIPGSYNASVFINYDDRINVKMDSGHLDRGKSYNHSTSLRLGHNNRLSMIELFPGSCLCSDITVLPTLSHHNHVSLLCLLIIILLYKM